MATTWMIARISSLVTPLFSAPRQWISHSCILPSAPIMARFIIDRVLGSITSSPQPKPQHHAVIASWKGRVKSSAAARFLSTYSAPSVPLRCSSPLRNRSSSNVLIWCPPSHIDGANDIKVIRRRQNLVMVVKLCPPLRRDPLVAIDAARELSGHRADRVGIPAKVHRRQQHVAKRLALRQRPE